MANQLDSLSKSVVAETGSSPLGNLTANVVVNVGGALVGGGTAGAATATNVDLYNRQLDTKEKSVAQQLADASGGKYTVAQIEDQMREMDIGAQDAGSTNSFLNGDGSQYFVSVPTPFGVNAFGAITHAYGGSTAVEIGFGSPGGKTVGVMPWGHSSPVGSK
jgi:hypothetical protein